MIKINNENDIHARHPMDLRYMKAIRFLLRMICSWPHQLLGEEVKYIPLRSSLVVFVEGVSVCFGGIMYIKINLNKKTFLELGQTYLTIFISIISTMYQYIYRICTICVTVILIEISFGVLLFNLGPMYSSYKKGMFNQNMPPDKEFEHSINYPLPFIDQYTNLATYIFIAIVNLLFSYDAATCFLAYELPLAVIVFHIWGHLKILDHDLRSIPTPLEMRDQKHHLEVDGLTYTMEENKIVAAKLKNIVDHHRLIMGFMTRTSDTFGPTLCLYYIFHQVSGCILLLECSKLNTESIARYGGLTVALFQCLIQASIIVELLGTQSETLKDAVYSVPWEYMDASNRRVVLFLLNNVQEPIRLKPMGMFSVGVQTMATILKTSFSYFMLLRTFE